MERVTDLCLRDNLKKYGKAKYIKVVFSQRGGHSYGQTKAYWEHLKAQAASGLTYLSRWEIKHEVLRYNLVDYVPHTSNAALQLADAVASAFYQSCDTLDVSNDPQFAKLLLPKMARSGGSASDYCLVLQPTPPNKGKLSDAQKNIFQYYGYDFGRVGLGPSQPNLR